MPFGSFNKKLQETTDARVGASDNAIVIQPGGFLFNPGRNAANTTTSAPTEPVNWLMILVPVLALVGVAWFVFKSEK